MADPVTLTHAFMRAHPAEAARVLESVPAAAAAALFAEAPARLGAGVLAAMFPGAAAQSLELLDDERALELLAALGAQPAAALLRHLNEERRVRLIGGLPTATALASRLLLAYPEDSAGAWANPAVIALPPGTHAAEALERVRLTDAEVQEVLVINAGQQLLGRVAVATLLRAPPATALDSLLSPAAGVLAAQTPLVGALSHPAWEQVSGLPVVESGDRLIGVLTRAALTQALRGLQAPATPATDETVIGLAARGYWAAVSGIVAATLSLLPAAGPIQADSDER